MKKLKLLDHKILNELLKNSKTSDRKLAQTFGVSQPTITRKRNRLEKEAINNYTFIPKWEKLGYEIWAITLVKTKLSVRSEENAEAARRKGLDWLMKQSNVIMSSGCLADEADSFTISVHKSYADYDEFLTDLNAKCGDLMESIHPILVNLKGKDVVKPFNLSYLAETH